MKKIIYALCIGIGSLYAQEPKADFKLINEKYYTLEKMSMTISYELFFDNDKAYSDREEGVYKRDRQQYYVKQAGNEMLITEKHIIMIDNDSKTVIVDKAAGKINPLNPLSLNLDSILNFYETIEFYKTGKNNELNAYTFKLKGGPYSHVDIVYDPATLFIKEIINTYREKMPDKADKLRTAKLRTNFTELKANPLYINDFNESKYVVSSDNKIRLTKKYRAYKLLTNLKNL